MRGRKPKPTARKRAAGNPGKRPLNDAEPQPTRGRPACPSWLDKEGKAKWKMLVPELERMGLLTVVDGDALAAYCQAWAEFRAATETVQAEGRTVRSFSESGGESVRPHPAVAQQRSAWKAIASFAALFGLDPSSRSRLKAPPAEEADELQLFLGGAS